MEMKKGQPEKGQRFLINKT